MKHEPKEIAPGVYGLVGGPVNVYVLDDRESGLVVVDSGLPGWAKRILSLVASIGRKAEDLGRILITHADIDHVGGLGSLVEATGAEVLASAEAALYIRGRRSPPHIGFPMIIPVAMMNFLFRRALPVARELAEGDRLDVLGGLRVISTPGHTPDHLCFFLEREGLLFAGDLFRNVSGLEPFPRNTWDRRAMAKSLEKAVSLNPLVICPGHGRVWRRVNGMIDLEGMLGAKAIRARA
jgi:glyoxylase-like metal-dependent hydrolase (beta-lactamase superfamily II)